MWQSPLDTAVAKPIALLCPTCRDVNVGVIPRRGANGIGVQVIRDIRDSDKNRARIFELLVIVSRFCVFVMLPPPLAALMWTASRIKIVLTELELGVERVVPVNDSMALLPSGKIYFTSCPGLMETLGCVQY